MRGIHRVCVKRGDGFCDACFVDVGHSEQGALFVQDAAEIHADVPKALYCDAQAGEIWILPAMPQACLHRIEGALGCEGRGITAGRDGLATHGMIRFHRHPVDELWVEADVLCRDVVARERINESAHGTRFGFGDGMSVLGQQDDALGAAHGQPRAGRFAGHAFGEPQYIEDRLFLGGVVPAAGAAEGRAKFGRVNRNDGAETSVDIPMETHALVAPINHLSEYMHDVPSS